MVWIWLLYMLILLQQLLCTRSLVASKVRLLSSVGLLASSANSPCIKDYKLTAQLEKSAEALRTVPDEKLRYQQLLFLASQAPPMDVHLKTAENKVPGCLSTVFVHARLDTNNLIQYVGDSDGQLTKGLVTLLVNGLSGNSAEDIAAVDPAFITYTGITQSLTPGRNNGFLNMLKVMKTQAIKLKSAVGKTHVIGGLERSMLQKLSMLQPTKIQLVNESHLHAGHVGVADSPSLGETHFKLEIIADCFNGLSLVQRHQLIYTLLADELQGGLHALSISARCPDDVHSI